MSPRNLNSLSPIPSSGISQINSRNWFRAVLWKHWKNRLGFSHTFNSPSRFSSGSGGYPLLYLAPDPLTAYLEVRALIRLSNLFFQPPLRQSVGYAVFRVRVTLRTVVDLGEPSNRLQVRYTAQELTGDWRDYKLRSASGVSPAVRSCTHVAPTQRLGALIAGMPTIEGFLAPSAVNPTVSNLVLLPDRLAIDQCEQSIARKLQ